MDFRSGVAPHMVMKASRDDDFNLYMTILQKKNSNGGRTLPFTARELPLRYGSVQLIGLTSSGGFIMVRFCLGRLYRNVGVGARLSSPPA